MTDTTWHGARAVLTASEDPAHPWIVTLPEGHAEYGYAPGSEFLADYAALRDAEAAR